MSALSQEKQQRVQQLRDLAVSAPRQSERSEAVRELINLYEQQLAAYGGSIIDLTEQLRKLKTIFSW